LLAGDDLHPGYEARLYRRDAPAGPAARACAPEGDRWAEWHL